MFETREMKWFHLIERNITKSDIMIDATVHVTYPTQKEKNKRFLFHILTTKETLLDK